MSSSPKARAMLQAAKATGLTVDQICDRSGLSRGTVSNELNGTYQREGKISDGMVRKLAKGFGIPYRALQQAYDEDWEVGRLTALPTMRENIDVPGAILADTKLLPEARAHLINQYELLLRLQESPPAVVEEQERRRQKADVDARSAAKLRAVPREPGKSKPRKRARPSAT